MAKSLSKKLEAKRRSVNFLGIRIVRGANSINHSQFVDDTFLFRRGICYNSKEIQKDSWHVRRLFEG
jgi:hypothetical protein